MVTREASETLATLAKQFRAIAVVGPRQSGKSTLVKHLFPEKKYITLENPEERERAAGDTRGFLKQLPQGAIIDEAQRVPELFNYLQQVLDESNERGKFILTGSNNFLMLEKITQSLAGRIGYIDLLPLSLTEIFSIPGQTKQVDEIIFNGGYPPVCYENIKPKFWFPAYVRTYVERDVRQIKNITDLSLFQKLLFLCVGRIGQQLNLSNLSIECGVDHKTIQSWLTIMQTSYIIHLLQPHHKNFSKRIVKSPKLYFYDTGLACSLLSIQSAEQLQYHAMRGALFENLIVNELIKRRFNQGLQSNLFYWRDVSGHELDVILDFGNELIPVEIKSGMTVSSDFFNGIKFWQKLTGIKKGYVVYAGEENYTNQGINVVSWTNAPAIISHTHSSPP